MCPKHIREDFSLPALAFSVGGCNMKFSLIATLFIVIFAFLQSAAMASASTAGSSAILAYTKTEKPEDNRAKILEDYLNKYDSPLAPYAKIFIEEADKNNLDWKLVVSIAGNESYFGHLIPFYSYNAWGYGVYGNNVRNFYSWENGIEVVSNAIRTDYINTWGAQDVYEIGSFYAEDPLWANKITHYMTELEEFESKKSNTYLSISL